MEFISVDEAAAVTGLSRATIRRRLANGSLAGEKLGRDWRVDAQAAARLRRASATPKRLAPPNEPAVRAALRHLRTTDSSELWIPDVLRWEDHFFGDDRQLVQDVLERINTGRSDAATKISVPKTPFLSRDASLLSFEDRVAYQAGVASFATLVESALHPEVFSSRLSSNPNYFLKRSTGLYVEWQKQVTKDLDTHGPWLVRSDLTAYFDCVDHDQLIRDIAQFSVAPEVLSLLRAELGAWATFPGRGLPQGPNASRVLGNLYMHPVDEHMLSQGYRYSRYMDDVRIAAETRAKATEAMREFERACRARGLIVSSAKTEIVTGPAAREEGEDPERRLAQYHFDANHGDTARRQLRKILTSALGKDGHIDVGRAKFALWRLARLIDSASLRRVLTNLEHLGPVASASAAYFRFFLQKRQTETGLAEFLNDPERNTSDVLESWLFAAILEHPGVLPAAWIDRARVVAHDANFAPFHRAIAMNVISLSGTAADVQWLRSQTRDHHPELVRAAMTALTRVSSLDQATSLAVGNRIPSLRRTALYLKGRRELPSLVYRGRTVHVRPARRGA